MSKEKTKKPLIRGGILLAVSVVIFGVVAGIRKLNKKKAEESLIYA